MSALHMWMPSPFAFKYLYKAHRSKLLFTTSLKQKQNQKTHKYLIWNTTQIESKHNNFMAKN